MGKIHLSDRQWAFIHPHLPPPAHTGRPRAGDRCTIDGILYVLITGCRWQDLPLEYGAATTVWRRLNRWEEEGVWERLFGVYRSFFAVAIMLLSVRVVVRRGSGTAGTTATAVVTQSSLTQAACS